MQSTFSDWQLAIATISLLESMYKLLGNFPKCHLVIIYMCLLWMLLSSICVCGERLESGCYCCYTRNATVSFFQLSEAREHLFIITTALPCTANAISLAGIRLCLGCVHLCAPRASVVARRHIPMIIIIIIIRIHIVFTVRCDGTRMPRNSASLSIL